jgi:hypothetical protein
MFAASMNPLSGLALLFIIGIVLVAFFISLSISAFILKLACHIVGVDVPDTGKAMVISFLESFVQGVLYVSSMITAMFVGAAANAHQTILAAFAALSAVSVTFLVPAGLYVPMLRVTFQKGLVISVLRYVITFVLVAGIGLVFMSMAAAAKVRAH